MFIIVHERTVFRC